jgi:hypothetical protein
MRSSSRGRLSPLAASPASRTAACTSRLQPTALSTLENSTSTPSPVDLTSEPRCASSRGSMTSRRSVRQRAWVRSSSRDISAE